MTDAIIAGRRMIENMLDLDFGPSAGTPSALIAACWNVECPETDDHSADEKARVDAIIVNLTALPDRERLFVERLGAMPMFSFDACMIREGEDTLAHLARNLAYPPTPFMLAGRDDENLPGIVDILLDTALDNDGRVALIAAIPNASVWIDFAVNRGPHPDAGQYYTAFDGEKHWDVLERGTGRCITSSKWRRRSESMASILSAFPHFADPYTAAIATSNAQPYGTTCPELDDVWARMKTETAAWRETDPDNMFFDPFKPMSEQIDDLLAPPAK